MDDSKKFNGSPSKDNQNSGEDKVEISLQASTEEELLEISTEEEQLEVTADEQRQQDLSEEGQLEDPAKVEKEVGPDKGGKQVDVDEEGKQVVPTKESLKVPGGKKLSKTPIEGSYPEKRVPRLNRRGYQQINIPVKELESAKAIKSDAVSKNKPDVPVRKIISLASVKKSSIEVKGKDQKKIVLKRTLSCDDFDEKAETSQAPPKKKYKPITWP